MYHGPYCHVYACAVIPMPNLVMEKSDHETCCTCISVGSYVNTSPTRQVDPQGQHVRGRSQGHGMKARTNNRQPYLRTHVGLSKFGKGRVNDPTRSRNRWQLACAR